MKKWIVLLLASIASHAYADTPPPGAVKIKGATDGTLIGNVGDSTKVNVTGGTLPLPTNAAQETGGHLASIDSKLANPMPVTGTFWQTTQPVSGSLGRTWTLGVGDSVTANIGTTGGLALDSSLSTINTTLGSPFQAGGSIGNTAFGISGTLPAFASTPTVNLGTISTAATAANQSSEITALGTINTTLGAPMQNSGGSVTANAGTNLNTSALNLESTQSGFKTANHSDLGAINTTLGTPMQNSGGSVTANAGTNLNTSALALESGGHLASIDSKLANPMPITSPVNANSTLSPRQTVTGTESYLVAPANTVGILFECESVNADAIRWGFSNGIANILSTTLGVLCEAGRSVDYMPIGAGNYLHMIALGGGSDFMDVQWVLSQ